VTAVREAAPTVPPACSVHSVPITPKKGELRTRQVVYLTLAMMVAELVVGYWTHSLALTADGWHMGTHAGALGLSLMAYWYARTRAGQTQFAFGTGKVYALSGYTSAGLLVAVALSMVWAAVHRFIEPEVVEFGEALPVAVLGLLVNLVSAKLLAGGGHDHGHQHDHAAGHDHDHNLAAAYLHVLSDALTSVLAIGALVLGRYAHWGWADPAVGLIGAAVILKWGFDLLKSSARQLIDLHPSTKLRDEVCRALEAVGSSRVEDLHLWRVGPAQLVCVASVSAQEPASLDAYKAAAMAVAPIDHLTIEICRKGSAAA